MMAITRSDIICSLRQLDADHASDNDGGDVLIGAIRSWVQTLPENSRETLLAVLLEFVASQHPTMWAVALEALVQENPGGLGEELTRLLESAVSAGTWTDQIVLALLRLQFRAAAQNCLDYISKELANGRDDVLPLLAALCRVAPDKCIALSSNYFAQALETDQSIEKYIGYIPAFVRQFMDIDGGLLPELVVSTAAINTVSARYLVQMMNDYMNRPFFVREIGQAKARAVREQISALPEHC